MMEPGSDGDELNVDDEFEIDRLCVRFERAIRAGQKPKIEDYLPLTKERLRSRLLRELLLHELEHQPAGRTDVRRDYERRFAKYRGTIDNVFNVRLATVVPQAAPEAGTSAGLTASALSDTSVHGRFLPGTKIAGRYRIVALLGRGGMGEVYRADDLKLHQTVALKFLPKDVVSDPARLAYFHSEVRLSREVSHPNVCRVYDIGEVDGELFLSMEYIDGEDLQLLLRRIGQLPREKAVQIAQQICAGLSAAHDRGVLHRDLKPANVMIDGRGHARITDFGLARLVEAAESGKRRVGTPAYMAPEQLAGGQTSIASDVYALGLLLYEVFTGQKPCDGQTLDELLLQREQQGFPPPSTLVADLDTSIDRIILQCLEADPSRRPQSVRTVSAVLPGGSPLEAALAAGETPSPELVAAGGERGTLRPALAVVCLAGLFGGMAVVIALGGKTNLIGRSEVRQPALLVDDAQSMLQELGWYDPTDPPSDMSYGFDIDGGVMNFESPDYSQAIYFWYRQSPQYMLALRKTFFQKVTQTDPPPLVPGMASVRLDGSGRLRELYVVPHDDVLSASSRIGSFASVAFIQPQQATIPEIEPGIRSELTDTISQFTGLDLATFAPTDGGAWIPPTYATRTMTWLAPDGDAVNKFVERVEAAFLAERLVYVHVVPPWRSVGVFDEGLPGSGIAAWVGAIVWFGIPFGMILLAWHNLRLGRGDRSGAARLAATFLLFHFVRYVLITNHVPGPEEFLLLQAAVAAALYEAATAWVGYLALEPYLRRLWPEAMVSWSRLLSGRIRDPIVGRDVLVGLVAGAICGLIWELDVISSEWLGTPTQRPIGNWPIFLFGAATVIGQLPAMSIYALILIVMISFSVILLRLLTGRQRWAIVGAVIFWTLYLSATGNGSHPYTGWFFNGLVFVITLGVLARFGVLAGVFAIFGSCVIFAPLTGDLSVWYAELGLIYAAALLLIGGFSFYTSLGGQSLFRDRLLADVRRT